MEPSQEESTGPTGPSTISYADVLTAVEYLLQKESADKASIESIAEITFDSIRSNLIQWALSGFQELFTIYKVPLVTPSKCSDDVVRTTSEYIKFVSGKTIQQHIDELQARFVDMRVTFSYNGVEILVLVSKM